MHGQKRSEYKSRLLNPETLSKLATKAQQWNHLSHELLTQRRRLICPPQSHPEDDDAVTRDDDSGAVLPPPKKTSPAILLAITEKMLSVNPDPSHLWNIRREMLLYCVPPGAVLASDDPSPTSTSQHNHVKKSSLDIHAELALTAHCLQRNPKSYSAWYHRKWTIIYSLTHPMSSKTTTSTTTDDGEDGNNNHNSSGAVEQLRIIDTERHLIYMKSILESELELCAQFLQMDERNFHCWNYRRFVVALLGSCGGNGTNNTSTTTTCNSSSTVQKVANDMVDESDRDLFTGSWSSWLNRSSTAAVVSMGAQAASSSSSCRGQKMAIGTNIPYHSEEGHHGRDDDNAEEKKAYNNNNTIAKSIVTLSQEELNNIIINEWNFTTSKIHDNFSNGSAFHYRSKLLPLILESRLLMTSSSDDELSSRSRDYYDAVLALAREEWENILLNAIFTEPDDQTPWWYHRFIVSWIKPSWKLKNDDDNNNEMMHECELLLHDMADSLRELLEVEKENDVEEEKEKTKNNNEKDESKGVKCKWAYIGLHLVISTILEVFQSSMDEEKVTELKTEVEECLNELIRIDPNRKERYQNLAAKTK